MGRIIVLLSIAVMVVSGFFLWRGADFPFSANVSKVFGEKTVVKKDPPPANNWFPKLDLFAASKNTQSLVISAKSVLLVDFDSGKVIFAKNVRERLPAASTIKIMTALLSLERAKVEDVFAVSERAASVGEDSMGLEKGEQLTARELLYGLMLVSGNDAATTLAEGVGGSEDSFVLQMNERAKSLGLSDTFFINATGLDVDGRSQYTTVFDLATIAHYAWQNHDLFRKIASTEHFVIEANDKHKGYDLYNQTNLLTSYPGVRGIKPGFTWNAGLCLVTYAENDGVKLLGVILGSDNRRGEMKELLDYGYAKYGIKVEHPGLDL